MYLHGISVFRLGHCCSSPKLCQPLRCQDLPDVRDRQFMTTALLAGELAGISAVHDPSPSPNRNSPAFPASPAEMSAGKSTDNPMTLLIRSHQTRRFFASYLKPNVPQPHPSARELVSSPLGGDADFLVPGGLERRQRGGLLVRLFVSWPAQIGQQSYGVGQPPAGAGMISPACLS